MFDFGRVGKDNAAVAKQQIIESLRLEKVMKVGKELQDHRVQPLALPAPTMERHTSPGSLDTPRDGECPPAVWSPFQSWNIPPGRRFVPLEVAAR